MRSCDDMQVDLERRVHGALDVDGARELDAHLAGCETCRAAQRLVEETRAQMVATADAVVRDARWDVAERRLAHERRELARARWVVPVATCSAGGVAFALGVPLAGAIVMVFGGVVITLLARALLLVGIAVALALREVPRLRRELEALR